MLTTSRQEYTTLVLDLGGVLAIYSTKNAFKLPASLIKSALDCPDWHDYEKGLTSEAECYAKICKEFSIDLETWAEVLEQMRQGLIINRQLISSIKDLRQAYPSMTVVCLSNIPVPELDALSGEIESWGIIDYFIASSAVQERKPDTTIYMKCLNIIKSSASSSIFVDDKIDRVVAAQTLGFKGIVFNNTDDLIRQLHNLFGDPLKRAKEFLRRNAKNLFCTLSTGEVQPDNYSQLIILQNTGDRYVNSCAGSYPNDSDTTSLAMAVLEDTPMSLKLQARDEILSHLSPDGLPLCWLNKTRPRFCQVICANVFRFFVIKGWSEKLPRVYDFLCRMLETRAYLHGSRYYKNPDWFLYNLSDLCARRSRDSQHQRMRDLLVECVRERMGCNDDTLGAALRALGAQSLGLQSERDLRVLLEQQQLDGGWEMAWLWGYGTKDIKIGSRGVVTAMAMNAIQRA
ncbi:HAD-like domain-containing protein [Fusarium flagelliforme]|uniref:HAD-like domain-containing protein n=1 Tax=Fusarium flagelliforme TaxID=2675880 RepID=UPI001E8E7D06|nr:HAD-like domain-containing protein [Fusarium flagelliforme]KAH7174881.1 HAD-like domain-containing protein [Fusarium flagelliforme]